MARREQSVSRTERLASLAVLAVLCGLAAWMLAGRTRLNPAVEVALRAPALKAQAGPSAAGAASPEALAAEGPADPNVPAAAKPATLAGLLPEDAPGLKPLAKAEAFTPATLSDKIDGKAELYLAAGFAGMACRSYQAGSARIDVYIYRMKTTDAAFAAFSGQRRPGAAQSPLAKNGYLTENALFLTHGADYIEVIADRAGAKPALEALAKAVLAGLGAGGDAKADAKAEASAKGADVPPGDLFPKAGLKADSLRLSVADTFGFQGFANVYTADYDQSAGGGTAFIARRPGAGGAAEARKIAQAYQRFLTDNGYAVQTQGGAPAGTPGGAVVLAMEGSVEILLVRGNILAGVHDAPDLASALTLANSLDAALKARGLDK